MRVLTLVFFHLGGKTRDALHLGFRDLFADGQRR